MQNIKKLLCVIDPTVAEQPALRRAAWLARNMGAELELFICCYNEYLSGDRFFDSPSLDKARSDVIDSNKEKLEELAAPLRKEGLQVTTEAVWDHPLYEGIVRQAARSRADLVLKDTHHHSSLSRALLTNTDWNLIRTCLVPLWLVKPKDNPTTPVFIAAIDPMNQHDKPAALDDEILIISKRIAEEVNGEVHAFHSFDPRVALATATANAYIPVSLPFDEIEEQIREQHKTRFDELTEFHGLPAENTHLMSGVAHEELPSLANGLSAAVVVMGAVARNRWKRLFIGATAERTLEQLPCDLLIIKPDWFHTPVELAEDTAA